MSAVMTGGYGPPDVNMIPSFPGLHSCGIGDPEALLVPQCLNWV